MSSSSRSSVALVSVVAVLTAVGCADATPEPEPSTQGAALSQPADGTDTARDVIGSEYFEEEPSEKGTGEANVTRSGCWVTLHECEFSGFGTCTANGQCSSDRMRSACASLRARYCGR
jgi:hypothetical protein